MTEVANTVNVGIIGAGDHSTLSHTKYLADMPELCNVVALADIDEDRMGAVNEALALNASETTNWEELVHDQSVEAIFIMTPDRFHTAQLVGAVAAGKHVFCEKPLASTRQEYNELTEAFKTAEDKGLIVSTCHPRRFDPPFVTTKRYLEDPKALLAAFGAKGSPDTMLGELSHFEFNFRYHKPSKTGLHASLMFDHLNHEVDAMHFLFGTSGIKHAQKHRDSETNFYVTGVRADGISFSFGGARDLEEKIYPETMRIHFEQADLAVDMHQGIAVLGLARGTYSRRHERYQTNYTERFGAINRHFLRSIRNEEPPYITPEEMLINTKAAIDLIEDDAVEN